MNTGRFPFLGQRTRSGPTADHLDIGTAYVALRFGLIAGDWWGQSNTVAGTKRRPGSEGRRACAKHVAIVTAAQAASLGLACVVTGRRLDLSRVVTGLAVNGASHFWADRRTGWETFIKEYLGKAEFYEKGKLKSEEYGTDCLATGAHMLDRTWHDAWNIAAAVYLAGLRAGRGGRIHAEYAPDTGRYE